MLLNNAHLQQKIKKRTFRSETVMNRQFNSENGVGLTSETLDNEYLLSEIVKQPPNVSEEE